MATWTLYRETGGARRVAVEGDFDLADEMPLLDEVGRLVADSDGIVEIDLSGLRFMDSSGVRALIRLHQRFGDRVHVVALSAPARRVLDLAGLIDFLGARNLLS